MSTTTFAERRSCGADAAFDDARPVNRRRFVLKNTSRAVHSFVRFVEAELCRQELSDESSRMHILLALGEALANALYHGNLELSSQLREHDDAEFFEIAEYRRRESPYRDRRIQVEVTVADDRAVIAVRDDGAGFDPAAIPDPCDPANIGRVTGRGLLLMRSVMDQVTFNKRGNEVRMVKRWNPGP